MDSHGKINMGMKHSFDFASFSTDLTAFREATGLSCLDAGAQMGLSATTVNRAERGIGPPDIDNFLIMCGWMGRLPGHYFRIKTDKPPNFK
jgi:transcriptional regulator with XRE-family HTH domain